MAASASAPPITIEQYLGFAPPAGYRDELIEGKIIVSPDPKPQHFQIAYQTESLLRRVLRDSPYFVGQRINFRLPDANSMPSPDVFVMERERWRSAVEANDYPSGAPVLAVEVVSPSNRRKEVAKKVRLYLDQGASEVWVVFPRKQQVVIAKPGVPGPQETTLGVGDIHFLPEPLPIVQIQIAEILDWRVRDERAPVEER